METALNKLYNQLSDALGGQATFYVSEVQNVFPEMRKSSLYWNLSKMVETGYLKRIRNGVYAFNEWKGEQGISLSATAEIVRDILDETGFDYYISGLDILQKYMQHVPEQYPTMIFVRKEARTEIADELKKNNYGVLEPLQIKKMRDTIDFARPDINWVILYMTENFDNVEDGVASTERAFVDLYYAITRNAFPLALQELVRIYQNLVRLGNIDKKRLISAASLRSIQHDVRFIVEAKFITEQAKDFVKILEREANS